MLFFLVLVADSISQGVFFHRAMPGTGRPQHSLLTWEGGCCLEWRPRDRWMCAGLPLTVAENSSTLHQSRLQTLPQRTGPGFLFSPRSSIKANLDTRVIMCKVTECLGFILKIILPSLKLLGGIDEMRLAKC